MNIPEHISSSHVFEVFSRNEIAGLKGKCISSFTRQQQIALQSVKAISFPPLVSGNYVWLYIQSDEYNFGTNLIKWVLNDVYVWFQFMVFPCFQVRLTIFSCVYYSMESFYC